MGTPLIWGSSRSRGQQIDIFGRAGRGAGDSVSSTPVGHKLNKRQLLQPGVAVEKGTKAVISVNFRLYGRRTFNNLRTNFAVEIP